MEQFTGLTYLFIVDDERYGDLSVVGPLQAGEAFFAVTFEIAFKRIIDWRSVDFRHDEYYEKRCKYVDVLPEK